MDKEIKVFEAEDKMIADKLEKRRQSHLEKKRELSITTEESSPKQEPSSTVRSPPLSPAVLDLPSPVVRKKQSSPSAWKGFVDIPEVCKFFTTAHGVHGNTECLKVVRIYWQLLCNTHYVDEEELDSLAHITFEGPRLKRR